MRPGGDTRVMWVRDSFALQGGLIGATWVTDPYLVSWLFPSKSPPE